MMSKTRVIKFLILSDTHNFNREEADLCPLKKPLPKVDVVLHCGDLTSVGGAENYKKALEMLGHFDAELKLVIAGNHDLDLDEEYWRANKPKDREKFEHCAGVEIMTGALAKAANVTYLTEGTYGFSLKDGRSFKVFASPYQPEFCNWAFGYKRGKARWKIPDDVDIVMTHGPPHGSLDSVAEQGNKKLGCETLLEEVKRVKPLMHCFGHIHDGYGWKVHTWSHWNDAAGRDVKIGQAGTNRAVQQAQVTKGESTLMINASIMNEDYQPKNAPWVIELPL